jgi:hypothetical protein
MFELAKLKLLAWRIPRDYDEGYRFTVAEVILETMMKVAGSL